MAAVQKAQRLAPSGISLRHSGHLRVVGSGGGSLRIRDWNALYGTTTKKNTAAAIVTNEISAFRNDP
jgi:hypothetical protein